MFQGRGGWLRFSCLFLMSDVLTPKRFWDVVRFAVNHQLSVIAKAWAAVTILWSLQPLVAVPEIQRKRGESVWVLWWHQELSLLFPARVSKATWSQLTSCCVAQDEPRKERDWVDERTAIQWSKHLSWWKNQRTDGKKWGMKRQRERER